MIRNNPTAFINIFLNYFSQHCLRTENPPFYDPIFASDISQLTTQKRKLMFPHLPPPLLPTTASLLVVLLPLLGFVLFAFLNYRKRLSAVIQHGSGQVQMKASSKAGEPFFPALIDKPAADQIHQTSAQVSAADYSDDDMMVMVDEDESFLLKSAENVVEQIQFVVDEIAAGPSPYPANPDEVFTKIRAIVSQYRIFENTEYYDAINNFVAVTVQRDCDLALTPDDLKGLWLLEAA
jgi:hypothetical protein